MFHKPMHLVSQSTVIHGKTNTIEVFVNGEKIISEKFDERTATLGDMLVDAIRKTLGNVRSIASNEMFNTYSIYEYDDGSGRDVWFS